MTALAIAGNPRFKLYSREIERGGVSYTVDTLRQLREKYRRAGLYFIMGADLCSQFSSWKDPAEIKKIAQLVVVTRQGHGCTMKGVIEVNMPRLEISSSLVRQYVKEKKSIRYLVVDKVKKYIEQKRFYR
jgi:nicotinate-nucleotide adenylyltransferase